ncbi:MAG: biotin/lipoyl-containing protein [Chloroflexota bacterium]
MKYVTILNGEQYEVEIDKEGRILLNGEPREVDFLALGPSLYSVITDNLSLQAVIEEERGEVSVLMGGRLYEMQVLDERALMMAQRRGGLGGGSGEITAPMPGLVVAVPVETGQEVIQGQTVVILESMKMQNELKSPVDGVVDMINVSAGQSVDKNAVLVVVTPPSED